MAAGTLLVVAPLLMAFVAFQRQLRRQLRFQSESKGISEEVFI